MEKHPGAPAQDDPRGGGCKVRIPQVQQHHQPWPSEKLFHCPRV